MGFFTKVKKFIMSSMGVKVTVGVAAAVVLGGAGIVFASILTKPENVLGAAIVKTFTNQTPAYEDVFGLTELSTAMEEKGGEMKAEVTFSDIPLASLGLGSMSIPSADIVFEVKQSAEKTANGSLALNVADASLLSLNTYMDENQIQVSVPELFNSVVSFSYGDEDLKQKMKDSYVIDLLGINDEEAEMIADSISASKDVASEEEIEQEMTNILMACYEEHFADVKVEKLAKEEISVGDEELKCKVFEIRLDEKNVNGFLKDFITDTVVYMQKLAVSRVSGMVEEDYAALEESMKDWEPGLQDELIMKFFVAKGRLVDMVVNLTAAEGDECCLEMKFAPEGYALGNMYCSLQAPDDVFIEIEIETENTKEEYTTEWKLTAEGEPIIMAFSYDKTAGSYEVTLAAEGVELGVDGSINELEKGVVFDATVENLRYSDGATEVREEMDASLRMATTEVEVAPLSGNRMDLLSMTEEDFNALSEESSTNITKKLFQLLGLVQ